MISPKKKKCRDCGYKTYIFSNGRCKYCWNIHYAQRKKEKTNEQKKRNFYKKTKRKNGSERQRLIREIDKVFSRIVRIQYADKNGRVKCFTCDRVRSWKVQQAGHYRSRSEMSTRWDHRNVFPQCRECNELLQGNLDIYCTRLQELYGSEICDELHREGVKPALFSSIDLKSMLENFKEELKNLRKNRNI